MRQSAESVTVPVEAARVSVAELPEQFDNVIERLAADGWVTRTRSAAWAGGSGSLLGVELTGKARRRIQQWPSDDAFSDFTKIHSFR
jgi:hypothetical protein